LGLGSGFGFFGLSLWICPFWWQIYVLGISSGQADTDRGDKIEGMTKRNSLFIDENAP